MRRDPELFPRYDFIKFIERTYVLEDRRLIQFEPWQKRLIIKPIFNRKRRSNVVPGGKRRYDVALVGLPKKNGKSTLASCVGVYGLLGDGEPDTEIYSVAGDTDQAKIIFSKATAAIKRSPALLSEVKIYKDAIERKDGGGVWKVLSADAPTSHGFNAHFVIWDELWNQKTYDLWEALTHSPAREQPLHFIVTYAGYVQEEGNLLWDLYKMGMGDRGEDFVTISGQARLDDSMYFVWTHKNHASWVSPEYLKKQRRRLPPHIYMRLHENRWSSPEGTMLDSDEVDGIIYPDLELKKRHFGPTHYLAADFGLKRDRAVVMIGYRDQRTHKIRLAHVKTFYPGGHKDAKPSGSGKKQTRILVKDVERHIAWCLRRFSPMERLVIDPWQMAGTIQKLEARGYDVWEFTFSGGNLTKMTQEILRHVTDDLYELPDYDELVDELKNVRAVQKSYGYRIDHESGRHDDHVITLGMLTLAMLEEAEFDKLDEDDMYLEEVLQMSDIDRLMLRVRGDLVSHGLTGIEDEMDVLDIGDEFR